jgi:hypothetical protein
MKFVWEMEEKKWNEFTDALDRKAFDVAYMEGEYLGCCRTGDLCFDIRAWSGGEWTGWGFELYCGGVDSGYGYSSREAMESNPEYESKYDVPDELLYPYDEVEYGEFPAGFETYTLAEFKEAAEKVFEQFIETENPHYEVSLIDKANEPLHVW